MKKYLRFIAYITLVLPVIGFSQQPENPGFEYWEDAGTVKDEPVDWSTIKTCDDPGIAAVAPVTFDRCDTARSGNYSLKLYNVYVGLVATGAITNGRFHALMNPDLSYSYTDQEDSRWHTVFTHRPESFTGWFKFYPQGNDVAQFKMVLHVDECKLPENGTMPNWVAMAVFVTEPGTTYDEWTQFSAPFTYFREDLPEYLFCTMNSGDSTVAVEGSMLLIDDLELIYPSSGISEFNPPEPFLVHSGNLLEISLEDEKEYLNQWFYIIDISGQTVFTAKLESNCVNLPASLAKGVYVSFLQGKERQYVQKITLQ